MPGPEDMMGMMGGGMPMPGMSPAGGGMMAGGTPPLGGPPPAAMAALSQMSRSAPGKGPKEALQEAQAKLQVALMRIFMTNPKVAKLVSDASSKINQAMADLEKEGQQPVGAPPNLMGGQAPMGQGLPFGMPGGR